MDQCLHRVGLQFDRAVPWQLFQGWRGGRFSRLWSGNRAHLIKDPIGPSISGQSRKWAAGVGCCVCRSVIVIYEPDAAERPAPRLRDGIVGQPVDLFISHSTTHAEMVRVARRRFREPGHHLLDCAARHTDGIELPRGDRAGDRALARDAAFVFRQRQQERARAARGGASGARQEADLSAADRRDRARGRADMLANKQGVERKALGNRLVETIEQLLAGARPIRTGVDEARARPAPEPPKKKSAVSPALIAAIAIVLLLGGGIAAWQGDLFGIEARKIAALKKQEDEDKRRAALRAEELKKQGSAQEAKAPASPKGRGRRKRQQAIKDEEERKRQAEKDEEERQRKAAIKPASLPLGAPSDITIQKTAPTVGDAVPGKTFFQECDICPVMSVVPPAAT